MSLAKRVQILRSKCKFSAKSAKTSAARKYKRNHQQTVFTFTFVDMYLYQISNLQNKTKVKFFIFGEFNDLKITILKENDKHFCLVLLNNTS